MITEQTNGHKCTSFSSFVVCCLWGFFLLPCVPGIVAFIAKNMEPLICFLFLLSWFEPLKLGIYKKLRSEPICRHEFVIPRVLLWFPATDLNYRSVFPACVLYFIRVMIPGTLCSLADSILVINCKNPMPKNFYTSEPRVSL